jgi:hypothetical protein
VSGVSIESDHISKHPSSLVEWTVTVVFTVSVLLQKVILDDLSYFQCDLVCFIQTRLHSEKVIQMSTRWQSIRRGVGVGFIPSGKNSIQYTPCQQAEQFLTNLLPSAKFLCIYFGEWNILDRPFRSKVPIHSCTCCNSNSS